MAALTLDKQQCLCMAYLPADAIWALGPRIAAGALTHVEISVGPLRYGSADLLSLNLVPEGLVMPAT